MFTKKNLGLSDSLIEVVKKVVKKEDKDKVEKDIKKGDRRRVGNKTDWEIGRASCRERV